MCFDYDSSCTYLETQIPSLTQMPHFVDALIFVKYFIVELDLKRIIYDESLSIRSGHFAVGLDENLFALRFVDKLHPDTSLGFDLEVQSDQFLYKFY